MCILSWSSWNWYDYKLEYIAAAKWLIDYIYIYIFIYIYIYIIYSLYVFLCITFMKSLKLRLGIPLYFDEHNN